MKHRIVKFRSAMIWALIFGLLISGCSTKTNFSTEKSALSLDQTSAENYEISDFATVHAADAADPNKYLIFGSIPISHPAADLPPELAGFLGRWEGYSFAPPVKKDRKVVLSISEITPQGGIAYGWSGSNLQFPDLVEEIHFRVANDGAPAIEWQFSQPGGGVNVAKFTYDKNSDALSGVITDSVGNITDGPYELTHDQSFYVYQKYDSYLAGKNITTHPWQNNRLTQYGKGYMLYLPEGYEKDATKPWPLIFFLHGYGDRGANLLNLAKASPFMYIREKGPLPFIIVAPLLDSAGDAYAFPNTYLDGALAEIRSNYRVDDQCIYVTGLSMGGEGTWQFALHQPDLFAAIAPLSAYYSPISPELMTPIKALPVWAIHGADDTVVPLYKGQEPVEALQKAGGNVKFSILAGHDHDTWTDTYLDPAFYDWLLQYNKKLITNPR